jgi:hypothetical protein
MSPGLRRLVSAFAGLVLRRPDRRRSALRHRYRGRCPARRGCLGQDRMFGLGGAQFDRGGHYWLRHWRRDRRIIIVGGALTPRKLAKRSEYRAALKEHTEWIEERRKRMRRRSAPAACAAGAVEGVEGVHVFVGEAEVEDRRGLSDAVAVDRFRDHDRRRSAFRRVTRSARHFPRRESAALAPVPSGRQPDIELAAVSGAASRA